MHASVVVTRHAEISHPHVNRPRALKADRRMAAESWQKLEMHWLPMENHLSSTSGSHAQLRSILSNKFYSWGNSQQQLLVPVVNLSVEINPNFCFLSRICPLTHRLQRSSSTRDNVGTPTLWSTHNPTILKNYSSRKRLWIITGNNMMHINDRLPWNAPLKGLQLFVKVQHGADLTKHGLNAMTGQCSIFCSILSSQCARSNYQIVGIS